MKILIAYATTDGQTRKIVEFCADWFSESGHTIELLPVADAEDVDLGRFDRAILAGSVHVGGYQKELVRFTKEHVKMLGKMPTMFMSVSLSAAGDDKEDWAGLNKILSDFQSSTGWIPNRIEHVAGAFRFTEYDFLRTWAMRWIAHQKGQDINTTKDTEYTDWEALAVALKDWAHEDLNNL